MTPLDHQAREFNRLRERLASEFGLDTDDEAVIDTAEGETDLAGLLTSLIRKAMEREAQAEVCEARTKALQMRKKAHIDAANKYRALVAETMLETGLKRLSPGDFTATVRTLPPKPEVADLDALPEFYRRQEIKVVPDKDAIKGEWERCQAEGQAFDIPGVTVTNGRPSLTVRT